MTVRIKIGLDVRVAPQSNVGRVCKDQEQWQCEFSKTETFICILGLKPKIFEVLYERFKIKKYRDLKNIFSHSNNDKLPTKFVAKINPETIFSKSLLKF